MKTSGDGKFGEHMVGGLVHDVVNNGTNGSGRTRVTLEIPIYVFGRLEME